MMHITPMILTGLVILAAAIFFGRLAIQHWRDQRRSLIECLGLRWDQRSATDLLVGLAITALVMLAIFACEMAGGGIARGPATVAAEPGMPAWKATLTMLFAAPEEEIINRSVLLSGLAIAFGGRTKLAVILSAVVFGLGHLTNPGECVGWSDLWLRVCDDRANLVAHRTALRLELRTRTRARTSGQRPCDGRTTADPRLGTGLANWRIIRPGSWSGRHRIQVRGVGASRALREPRP
jgi:Type II CAAX prenyl endopeptidase Rce1-like